MRKLDVLNLGARELPEPAMPSACQTGGCGGADFEPSEPIKIGGDVTVAGEKIDEDAIAREMQHHPAGSVDDAWLAAARALAVRQLLSCEADAEGKDDEAAIQRLLEERVDAEQPGEVECRRLYDADPSRFASPALVEAGHILIEPEEDSRGGWERARLLAGKLIADIDGDAGRFADAARRHSGCPSGKQDGSLGQVRKGELTPEIETALDRLGDGEIAAEPVRSRHGWHVLRVNRRIPGKQLPFELVKVRIADMLEARSWTVAAGKLIAALAQKYPVKGIDLAS